MANVKGFSKVKANLRKALKQIENQSAKGLIQSAILIRVDMDKTPPLIPIDLGNLRASWFTNSFRTFKGPGLMMGFSANYAAAIHEKVGAKFQRPGSGPKFFEASLKRNRKEIINIIGINAKV